jgi:hypothetical protein
MFTYHELSALNNDLHAKSNSNTINTRDMIRQTGMKSATETADGSSVTMAINNTNATASNMPQSNHGIPFQERGSELDFSPIKKTLRTDDTKENSEFPAVIGSYRGGPWMEFGSSAIISLISHQVDISETVKNHSNNDNRIAALPVELPPKHKLQIADIDEEGEDETQLSQPPKNGDPSLKKISEAANNLLLKCRPLFTGAEEQAAIAEYNKNVGENIFGLMPGLLTILSTTEDKKQAIIKIFYFIGTYIYKYANLDISTLLSILKGLAKQDAKKDSKDECPQTVNIEKILRQGLPIFDQKLIPIYQAFRALTEEMYRYVEWSFNEVKKFQEEQKPQGFFQWADQRIRKLAKVVTCPIQSFIGNLMTPDDSQNCSLIRILSHRILDFLVIFAENRSIPEHDKQEYCVGLYNLIILNKYSVGMIIEDITFFTQIAIPTEIKDVKKNNKKLLDQSSIQPEKINDEKAVIYSVSQEQSLLNNNQASMTNRAPSLNAIEHESDADTSLLAKNNDTSKCSDNYLAITNMVQEPPLAHPNSQLTADEKIANELIATGIVLMALGLTAIALAVITSGWILIAGFALESFGIDLVLMGSNKHKLFDENSSAQLPLIDSKVEVDKDGENPYLAF